MLLLSWMSFFRKVLIIFHFEVFSLLISTAGHTFVNCSWVLNQIQLKFPLSGSVLLCSSQFPQASSASWTLPSKSFWSSRRALHPFLLCLSLFQVYIYQLMSQEWESNMVPRSAAFTAVTTKSSHHFNTDLNKEAKLNKKDIDRPCTCYSLFSEVPRCTCLH